MAVQTGLSYNYQVSSTTRPLSINHNVKDSDKFSGRILEILSIATPLSALLCLILFQISAAKLGFNRIGMQIKIFQELIW